ncbi:branched-chain amino acid ABC transporter permease [Lacrimispora sp. 210928-DFI.3.58]|uniref:branched-chain amino acid ABC transporter permease n=1 Tax=Lacrimispora sp. 210928-DFI.3.58 TaxID=2883214 RepID=UPI0015B4A365|nr:branched-chain amino acid ABC transporter permease [Lacrimispora sp. 210928-DFI.3.58]MCB7319016.1 branched-chain amino acid ABC transporter permease [Lacrimispora sp. 210928-DFI.3.58]
MDMFLQACVNGLLMGGFYSLMGMGQNIIFGVMKIVNFCHGEMLMVGMYLTFILYTYFGIDPYLAVPLVAVCMFCIGAVIQHTLITPSLGTKSFTNLLFLTVGLGLLLSNGALVIFGSDYRSIRTAYSQTYIPIGPVTMALPRMISFGVLVVVTIALFVFLKYTTIGKQIRAVSQNAVGAEVVGIDVKRIYILTYGLGVALAGTAGALLTQFYTIFPTAGASFGFRALIVVVVGGLGSIPGAFLAGIFLGLLETMSALFISPSYSDLIVFMTFIIILVVRQTMIARRK